MRIIFYCVLILTVSYAYAQEDFDLETQNRIQRLVNNLVSDGLLTEEQARSLMRGGSGVSLADLDKVKPPKIDESGLKTKEQRLTELEERERAIVKQIRHEHALSYQAPTPTFTETLDKLCQIEGVNSTHRTNYQKTLSYLNNNPTMFRKFNERFMQLTLNKKRRILEHVANGKSLENAFGKDKPVLRENPIDTALETRTPLNRESPVSDNNSDPYNPIEPNTTNIIIFLCAILVVILFVKKNPFVNRS